jgi:hypothetical protein
MSMSSRHHRELASTDDAAAFAILVAGFHRANFKLHRSPGSSSPR